MRVLWVVGVGLELAVVVVLEVGGGVRGSATKGGGGMCLYGYPFKGHGVSTHICNIVYIYV